MNIETNLTQEYVNFVEITTKQKTNFEKILFVFAIIISLFLVFLLFENLNE